jgi:hypothetical protein
MKTAVFLRRFPPRGKLCHGVPQRTVRIRNGEVALLGAGELAAYLIQHAGAHRLFVFRTIQRPDVAGAVRVPGVWPRVHLLAQFDRPGRIDRVENLFTYLASRQWIASTLSDLFWLRVSHVLNGRRPRRKVLLSLLSSEKTLAHELRKQPCPERHLSPLPKEPQP